jgi:hypothetical protein
MTPDEIVAQTLLDLFGDEPLDNGFEVGAARAVLDALIAHDWTLVKLPSTFENPRIPEPVDADFPMSSLIPPTAERAKQWLAPLVCNCPPSTAAGLELDCPVHPTICEVCGNAVAADCISHKADAADESCQMYTTHKAQDEPTHGYWEKGDMP